MKKALSFIIVVMMLTTAVFANGTLPAFLTAPITNYTADYSISMTFDNTDEIAALLDEIEMPQQVGYFIEIKDFLKTLFSYEGKMNLQADISENYDKIKLALTAESEHFIDFNANLNLSLNQKTGLWMDMDLTDSENPVFEMILSYPMMNKYLVITGEDLLSYTPETVDALKSVLNKEYIDSANKLSLDILEKYATIKSKGTQYTITMDNEGFTAAADEIMQNIFMDYAEGIELPSISGWQILGDKGIECAITLKSGKIASEKITMDISLALDEVYRAMTGGEWIYTSADSIDFTVSMLANVSKIGNTRVGFPALTEENSFTLADLEQSEAIPEDEMIAAYPSWYVDGYTSSLPVIDGEVYVPLRKTIVNAYEDTAAIDYNDGVITVSSEYFPGFDTIKLTVDTDKAYAGGREYNVGKIFTIDGSTYVSNKFFSDILGWELNYAQYDLVNKEYSYGFWTAK